MNGWCLPPRSSQSPRAARHVQQLVSAVLEANQEAGEAYRWNQGRLPGEGVVYNCTKALQEVGKSMPSHRNSMCTGMDETQEVKGEEGDEAGDGNTDQTVRALLFSKKIVLFLKNNGNHKGI